MDTQQRPCRLCGSISRVKWRWCPPLMSKWLYRLSLLSLLLALSHSSGSNSGTRWLTTCRLQTLLTGAQSLIRRNRSADMLSVLLSTSRKLPSPYSLCKAEGCHRSKVLLLMEQLLISQPKPPLSGGTTKRITPLLAEDLDPCITMFLEMMVSNFDLAELCCHWRALFYWSHNSIAVTVKHV